MRVLLLFIKYYATFLFRRVYWLFRLSQSQLGKNVSLNFPIIRQGNGDFKFGNDGVIQKDVEIGVGENASLNIGQGAKLEKKATILVNVNCSLNVGKNFKLGAASRLFVQSNWQFGDNVQIETNCSIFAREPKLSGKLIIGNDSNIGDYTLIDLVDDLTIGNGVAIGPNCTIYTHDHIYTDMDRPAWKGGVVSKPIIIKDGAWVGSGVTLLPGIVIGERAVVAAGSIVTKDLESNCIYGGNPAKLIKKITP